MLMIEFVKQIYYGDYEFFSVNIFYRYKDFFDLLAIYIAIIWTIAIIDGKKYNKENRFNLINFAFKDFLIVFIT